MISLGRALDVAPAVGSAGLALLGRTLATVVHEAGHAAGALAAGLTPRMVAIGDGPVRPRLGGGRSTAVLRALPDGATP